MIKLSFGLGNAKLSKGIATFSLPAGHSCPFALKCLSKADKVSGRIKDGPETEFRCFAASQESTYPSVRKSRWNNFELLKKAKTLSKMAMLIQKSLPYGLQTIRVHISGDFFNEQYFLAWLNVAINNPSIIFYGYTKCLPYLIKYEQYIPMNFRFTASWGGKADDLITKHNLKSAKVVFSVKEAESFDLEIDHDDSHAIGARKSFALLLHGTQPPGSDASKAWTALMRQGIGGYGTAATSRKVSFEKESKIFISIKNGAIYFPIQQINNKPLEIYAS